MREMKDSGIEWVGEIPSQWMIKRIKYVLSKNDGGVWGDDPIDGMTNERVLRSTEQTIDGKWDIQDPAERRISSPSPYRIKTGDLLITKSSGSSAHIGKTTLATETEENAGYLYSNFLQRLHTNIDMFPKYLWYLLNSPISREQFVWMQNSTIGIGNINANNINEVRIPFPEYGEQCRISDFLDSKCVEIDALSADIQSEIDTLEAYKRSVITEAVTRGLDKTVPMKDSGIEWVGEIPAHWVMQRGKYVFEQKSDRGNSKSLVLLSPTQNYGVIPQDLYEELSGFSAVKLNEKTDFNSLKTVHKGAFVISLRSFQGGFEYSEYEGVVSPAYQVFYPTIPVCDRYYKYLFKTQIFIDKMNSYTMSLRDGKNIAFADFGRTYIPIPPVDEQTRIANYLDDIYSQLNDVIAQKKEQLAVLANYKKAVIYEYVTGKKEVSYSNI